ncbi:MAG: RimK-like ATPgrasp N-terminal domain-containing protein [Methanomassiliicoccales archaeon]|jgi:hypothetical protein|nr:RimK-like ATPgrasp N-terminal domain-containing protein [Methanomassiliicoccales archaeon]
MGLSYKLHYQSKESAFVNIAGDYRYLSEGHYESVEAEVQEIPVYPRVKEALDAYVVPLCMERAKRAGIPVPEYYISNGFFEPPAIIYPINPFMRRHSVVYKEGHVKTIGKSLTRNYKYPILVQRIREDASIREFKCILGTTTTDEFETIANQIWNLFHLPICKVRVIEDGEVLLSAIEPLPLHQLKSKELKLLRKANEWQI